MRRTDMDTAVRRVRDIRLALGLLLVLSMAANLTLTMSFAGRETVTVLVPATAGPAWEVGGNHSTIWSRREGFPATTTTVPGGSRTGLAWMVTAGVGMAVGERAILDLAWRYTDLGRVRTDRGPGRVVWRDGSREPLPLDLAPTEARLRGHGIRLSLHYAF